MFGSADRFLPWSSINGLPCKSEALPFGKPALQARVATEPLDGGCVLYSVKAWRRDRG